MKRRHVKRRHVTVLLVALSCTTCTERERVDIGTQPAGASCSQISDCKAGLDCVNQICTPFETANVPGAAGAVCGAGKPPCGQGLCCGNQGVCRADPNTGRGTCGFTQGAGCGLSADCDVGLVCDGSGVCAASGSAGTQDVGGACEELADCRRPLLCGTGGTCERLPFFPGVSCHRSEEERGAFRMYFEVPRGMPLDEFYRQPFPSDVRVNEDGRLDLSGHPSPGAVMGVDFTKLYVDALEEDARGFGLSSPVFVRFSDTVEPHTISVNTATATVFLVDVDPMSPERGQRVELQSTYERDKSQFICMSSLAVAPIDGKPLRPSTTYALIVTTGVRSIRGETPIQDADFRAVIGAATPPDPHLAGAHAAFAPLRAYLEVANSGLDPARIAGASVFTTGDPGAIGPKIRAAVRAAPAPTLERITRCDAGVTSPCAAPEHMRACPAPSPRFHQIHALATNPMIQTGTRPYLTAGADGQNGAIRFDAQGSIVLGGMESLCVALSIPKTAMPAEGWPILLYAHGTGGDFLSGMGELASDLAEQRIAVLSFDGVMHGPRQGGPPATWSDPGPLFFNVPNPRAARDNVLQGAADLFNLLRLVETLELTAAQTGIAGGTIKLDRRRILFYGHSQGTTVAPPFLANEPNLRAAVLTGAGAEIGLSLLEKKKPNDVSSLVRAIFADQSLTRLHPVIGLLSFFFAPSDALPYGAAFTRSPPMGKKALDVLHVYGLEDGFTPESTQKALIRTTGMPLVRPVLRAVSGAADIASPARANLNGATAAVLQYAPAKNPDGTLVYDGHFVGTRDPQAKAAILRFLSSAATSDEPARIER